MCAAIVVQSACPCSQNHDRFLIIRKNILIEVFYNCTWIPRTVSPLHTFFLVGPTLCTLLTVESALFPNLRSVSCVKIYMCSCVPGFSVSYAQYWHHNWNLCPVYLSRADQNFPSRVCIRFHCVCVWGGGGVALHKIFLWHQWCHCFQTKMWRAVQLCYWSICLEPTAMHRKMLQSYTGDLQVLNLFRSHR